MLSSSTNNTYVQLNDATNEDGSGEMSPKIGAEEELCQNTNENNDLTPGNEVNVGSFNESRASVTPGGPRTGASQSHTSSPEEPLAKEVTSGYYGVIKNDGTTPIGDPIKDVDKKIESYRTKDFNPHLEFPPVSYIRSIINLFNNMIGTTIMALPYAMMEVGLSAPLVMVLSVACVYQSSIFMVESFHEDGNRSKRQLRYYYWHISSAAFGKCGTVFMANFQRLSYPMDIGWSLVLSSNSMNSVVALGNFKWVMILCGIVVAECIWFPNQKALSWISMIGIFNTLVCCVTLIVISTGAAIGDTHLWDTFKNTEFFELNGFFVSFNIMVLSFCTCLVLPNIYMEMQNKNQVNSMLYWGHILPMALKQVFMVIVFYAYQDDTNEIAILNVDDTYVRSVLAVTITIDKLVTIPLWIYPNRMEVEGAFWKAVMPSLSITFKRNTMVRSLLTFFVSTALLVPSVILACLVPSYWDCSVLIACIIVTPQTLLIPNIQWFILTKQKPVWKQVAAIGVFLLGTVCAIGGLVVILYIGDYR